MTTWPTDGARRRSHQAPGGLRLAPSLALAALVAAAAPLGAKGQGIQNSRHDLSASSASPSGIRAATDNQICKFCHTPHHAQSAQLLWNHGNTAQTTFNWGLTTATISGTPYPTTLRPQSKRCIDCHDGTVSLGQLYNAGGGSAGNVAITPVAGVVDAAGRLIDTVYMVGAGGSLEGTHPVSIPYAGESGYNGISSAVPPSQVNNAVNGYWKTTAAGCETPSGLCTQASGAPMNGARIQLFPNAPGTATNLGIECTSCHDPHNRYGYPAFERVDNTNASGLCRSCHNK